MKRAAELGLVMAVVAMATLGPGFSSVAPGDPKDQGPKSKNILVEEVHKIRNDAPGFEIRLWTEENKDAFKPNDIITFKFRANKDCYLKLLDMPADMDAYYIFPNKWYPDPSGWIEKDKVYSIPSEDSRFRFRVTGTGGVETVKAIATLDRPVQALEPFREQVKAGIVQIPKAELVMKSIRIELKDKDQKNWSESELSFKILDH